MSDKNREAHFITAIADGRATTKAKLLELFGDDANRLSERLSRRKLIQFDKIDKCWRPTDLGFIFVHEVNPPVNRLVNKNVSAAIPDESGSVTPEVASEWAERLRDLAKSATAAIVDDDTESKPSVNPEDSVGYTGPESSQESDASNQQEPEMTTQNLTDADINAALAKAQGGATAEKTKRARLSPEERAARDLQRQSEREAKRSARAEKKAAKQAERESGRSVPHMKKVNRAAEALPSLSRDGVEFFDSIKDTLEVDQVQALALHLLQHIRAEAVKRAASTAVQVGQTVRIVSSNNSKFVGKSGKVVQAQRIRCYVQVDGFDKPAYCYTSDVQVIEDVSAAESEKLAANG